MIQNAPPPTIASVSKPVRVSPALVSASPWTATGEGDDCVVLPFTSGEGIWDRVGDGDGVGTMYGLNDGFGDEIVYFGVVYGIVPPSG
ncbi:hypothetical protein A3F45_00160 [Candidatus Curtissbacteria bacterium RIFCSPHIGHO2_12_FULL_41_17]|uniref:Uncharacterized protein n=1 Tax=Candidatus Curtissbacteria bacterium RIFCSPHIGHO2_12_FULL_41_17 TaxID=1797722 RepID=A0A1F5HNA3_9BACT|nr:MAG: hypothetical protein A3F45_00160 [Candidatus Curtissbacteria bacterium RIFCSPHIGHO2_12_FULL_41_17]